MSEGIGLYRGLPPTIHDDLAPGQPPHPSEGRQGPPVNIPIEGWEHMREVIDALGQQLARTSRPEYVAGFASGQTDSSGDVDILLYRIAAGIEAHLNRLTVNAIVASTGVAYTPASPYSGASAYLEVYDADDRNSLGPSGLMDFASGVATGPQGSMFPGVFTDNNPSGMFTRGPKAFVLRVKGGPVSTQVFARYQLGLRHMHGVA